ncbi:MAG: hypothetical protein Q4G58_12955 [bacterium]|nr:hypothetical protein [bacterium]
MKRKVQIDYVLREVYQKGTISIQELRTYCFTRNIVQGQAEFESLIMKMMDKKYIGFDFCTDEVYFRKSNIIESFAVGITYFGTRDLLFYHYVS